MTYQSVVLADSPAFLWLLNETSGTVAADSSPNGYAGTYSGTYTQGQTAAPGVTTFSVNMNSSTGDGVYNTSASAAAASMSSEIWFNTTTTSGGAILNAANDNFFIAMDNSGKIWFAIWDGSAIHVATSASSYNNGAWHHAVATYVNGGAMVLYLDGAQVATGTNTVGINSNTGYAYASWSFNISGSPSFIGATITSDYFAGNLNAAAVYTTTLSPTQVANHYNAAVGASPGVLSGSGNLRVPPTGLQPLGFRLGPAPPFQTRQAAAGTAPFTSANITGIAAAVSVQGGAGTTAGGANVTGIAAAVTVQGGAGAASGGANVTGIGAAVTVQGGAGTTSGGANVTGTAAPVTVQGGVGTPAGAGGSNVTGAAAAVSVQGGAGTVSAAAHITGIAAAVAVQGGAGTNSGGANVTGTAAPVTVQGGVGIPAAGAVYINGSAAAVGVQGGVGTVVGIRSPENLGAAFTYANYGDTATPADYDATFTTTASTYGAGVTVPDYADAALTLASINGALTTTAGTYGGTVNSVTIDGSLVGWTMQNVGLTLAENNDETVAIAITQNGSPLSLSGATINMYLKTAAGTPDGSALLLSSAGGSPAITITNSSGGLCSALIPRGDLYPETYAFYRIDVVFGGLQNTCAYGQIVWITL